MSSLVERFAEVAVPVPLYDTFTYRIPDEVGDGVQVGAQVEVPFGRTMSPGFVVGLPESTDLAPEKIKSLHRITYPDPVFGPDILRLARWISDYYVAPLGEVLMAALPGGLRTEARRSRPIRPEGELGLVKRAAHLTPAQEEALGTLVRSIDEEGFVTFLLHGVTGSGKTEVYVRAAEHAVSRGRQVLVLVPEIALSFQVVERFRLSFGDRVGVLHSGLPKRARQDTWRAARSGALAVVVGARSAIFTPLPGLGLVVVDEEHESSYKQSETPRYHAREVGIVRAQHSGATVVLGSATPCLETTANTRSGKYRLLTLPERIDARPRATVEPIDLRADPDAAADAKQAVPILARSLVGAVGDRLDRKEQVILFLNRRGWAPYVQCRRCGESMKCHQCDVSLTYHRQGNLLVCHYCGERRSGVPACASCGSTSLHFGGVGTQKVEDELAERWPQARVLRLDADTTRKVGSFPSILGRFARGEADILLGTQMVARGLDFPNVTLVGVINADAGLNLPDFRSAERTFQLLTQVAGRAGRGKKPGHVLLQTFHPEHYALQAAIAQDHEAFFTQEIRIRRSLRYPPFSRMANVLFDGAKEHHVVAAAQWLHALLRAEPGGRDVRYLGPAPAPLSRLKGKFRWHLALRASRHARLRAAAVLAMHVWGDRGRKFPGVRLAIDIDPVDLL